MRGLHARFSDVHAHSFILETFGMLCALYGMLHYSVSSTLVIDLTSTRAILSNTSIRRCTRSILRSTTDLRKYEIDST